MADKLHILKGNMTNYYAGDPARIHHFLKVHSFAKWIAEDIYSITSLIKIGVKRHCVGEWSAPGVYVDQALII